MRKLFGILIVIIGIGMLFDATGLFHFWTSIEDWWPLLLIAIGIMSWKSNPSSTFGPLIMIGLGLVFLLSNLNVFTGDVWNYAWPVIVILVGYRMIVKKPWSPKVDSSNAGQETFVAFSGTEKQINSDNYTGGNVTAWFGGAKLDLRSARMGDNATVNVFAAFSGVEVLVPNNVRVELSVTPLFGGSEDKTQPIADSPGKLRITGTVLFGGIEVKN